MDMGSIVVTVVIFLLFVVLSYLGYQDKTVLDANPVCKGKGRVLAKRIIPRHETKMMQSGVEVIRMIQEKRVVLLDIDGKNGCSEVAEDVFRRAKMGDELSIGYIEGKDKDRVNVLYAQEPWQTLASKEIDASIREKMLS